MNYTKRDLHRPIHALALALLTAIACPTVNAAIEVLGVQYQQDNPYPEYRCWYSFGNYPTSCGTSITGCNAHVFLKNTGASPVTINDVNFAGYSLNTIIKTTEFNDHFPSSIYLYWDDPPADVLNAGEPVWYRADPNPIPAGGTARVVVRLRSLPVTQPVSVGVATGAGTVNTNVAVDASAPVLASVGFSTNRTRVYLHWRRSSPDGPPSGGAAPTSVWLNGTNVTSLTSTVGDPAMNFAVSVIQLPTALPNMSYHVFQGRYADGKTATGSLRVWVNRFLYGTWGVRELPDNDFDGVRAWIDECNRYGVNCYVNNSSGTLNDFMATQAGRDYAEARDYGYVKDSNQWGTNPRMWFVDDEPDFEEANLQANFCGTGLRIPCDGAHTPGILGRHLLAHGETLRAFNPLAPTTINLDGGFRPHGWSTYGQFADVMMMDCYYEGDQSYVHWNRPNAIPLFRKSTSIYAAAIATTTAAEPNPMHIILNSVETKNTSTGEIWPFAAPANKRIQVYYALAGGAKGMAYWWFKKGQPWNGLDANTPAALALWKEIGVCGNEIKTAQPLLVISHPVTLPLSPSTNVWARMLAADTNALILLAVNDSYVNDQTGTYVTNVPNASITATLPSWLVSSNLGAFEISAGGINDVTTVLNGNQLQVLLGTLTVTRMIVITTNPQWRTTIQQRYDQMIRANVCAFAPELCVNKAPAIEQHPSNQIVAPGGTARFALVVNGSSPLGYRWQRNNVNLNDGGHYSGCATRTLTITGADGSDAASYRCVVTNLFGTTNSGSATLTVTNMAVPPIITIQPTNRTVTPGGTAIFSVAAFGSEPLGYRWQKNNSNLNNGGHYSGSTTPTLTISNADQNDAANYRCVVTNTYGATNSATAALVVDFNVCTPGVLLRHGHMEDAAAYSVCPDWTSYSAGQGMATFAKEGTIVHGGAAAQKCQNGNGGAGSLLGVRQTFDANVGDAFTFEGWVQPVSHPYHGQQVAMVAAWNGSTASPTTNSATTWNVSAGLRDVWTRLQNLSGNATATNVTLFLDSRRTSSSQDLTAYWDDVVSYRAFVPPAPLLSAASSTSLNVDLLPGCNTNGAAQFAISIGGGAFTLGTHWVQANGTVNTTPVWQSDAAWANKTVTGLASGTAYTFKAQARYSSTLTQPTSLGAGATLSPSALPQAPQLSGQRNGNNLTLIWPESPSARLERAGSLTPPVSWATATNQVSVAGGKKSVTLTPTGSAGYFRLVLE